ncbi:MAG: hypothetical protein ACXVJT_05180 [Thermoanaerobaculia bacterium]
MILYRKPANLRTRRLPAPEPPWWSATLISPYSGRRGSPVSVDSFDMSASWSERLEVSVCETTTAELERLHEKGAIDAPVLIDAAEFAELVFRKGEEVLRFCGASKIPATYLASSRGSVPSEMPEDSVLAISAWPLDFDRLAPLCASAEAHTWGLVIPVIFPVTTNLEALSELSELASAHKAAFFAAAAVDLDPTAKQAIAQSLSLDDETYTMLFHADLDPIQIATERHIAALASEHGMHDIVVPPRSDEKSNWNAAALLMLTATRMLAMERDIDTATMIARSARAVAELNKPIQRIAEAASLTIVESLDEVSVEILTEWMEGTSWFVERVNREWRLRRDVGAEGG